MTFMLYPAAFIVGCVIGWTLGGIVEHQRQREASVLS